MCICMYPPKSQTYNTVPINNTNSNPLQSISLPAACVHPMERKGRFHDT